MKKSNSAWRCNNSSRPKMNIRKRSLKLKYTSLAVMTAISGMAQATTEITAKTAPQTFFSDSSYIINNGTVITSDSINEDLLEIDGSEGMTLSNAGVVIGQESNGKGALFINTDGTVTNESTGQIYAGGSSFYGITSNYGHNANVRNYGDISSASASAIYFKSAVYGSIDNYGTINDSALGQVNQTSSGIILTDVGDMVIQNHNGALINTGSGNNAAKGIVINGGGSVRIINDGLIDSYAQAIVQTGDSVLNISNNDSGSIISSSLAAVELLSGNIFENYGVISSVASQAILLDGNSNQITLGSGSALSGANNNVITSKGTGNTLTLTSSNAQTTIENGNITSDTADHGLNQLMSTVNSVWQLGGDISLSGQTADTLDVAGNLILSGSVTQNNSQGGSTIDQGGSLQLGNGGVSGMVNGAIVDNGMLIFDHNNNQSYAGVITGTGSLTQAGSDTLTLTGNNTYSGSTTINSGSTLSLGNGGTTGSVAGDISNSGSLILYHSNNVTESGVLSGTGSLTQNGTGTATLTGQNSSQGAVNVNSGTLDFEQNGIFNAASLNVASGAKVVLEDAARLNASGIATVNGELDVDISTGGPLITADSVTLGAGSTLNIAGLAGNTAVKASDVAASRTTVLQTTQGITGDFADVELGTASGPDYLLVDGTKSADNKSYSVGYELAWTSSTAQANGNFTLDGSDNFNVDVALADNDVNTVSGWDGKSLTKAGDGNLTLSALNTYSGTTAIKDGTLTTGIAHALDSSSGISVDNGATLSLNNFDQNLTALSGSGNVNLGSANLGISGGMLDGVISGSGTLTKTGSNTLVLGGNNTFSGDTTVSAGTLQIGNGANAGSIAGNLVDNAAVVFNRSDTTAYNGSISGSGSVTQQGSGTLSLGGSNNYSGGTTVAAGTLALTKAQAAGSGTIDVGSKGRLDLAFSDTSFTNTLNGAGKVIVSGNNITLADDATALSGKWDITGSASATQQSQLGNSEVMLSGANSALTLNDMGSLTNALTGNGTLNIHERAKTDTFTFSRSNGSAFNGTVAMQQGDLRLDDNAEQALSHATLTLTPEGMATIDSDRTVGNLTTGGGTLRMDNSRTETWMLTTGDLDASAGGAIYANIPAELTPPVVPTNPSYFDQDVQRDVQVIKATGAVTGEGNHLSLRDYDGNSVSNPTQVTIVEDGSQLGTATYDNAAVVTREGVWVGYDLVKLSANAGQTMVLQNEAGQDSELDAQLSGAGNFAVQAIGTVTLNNVASNYTGNTLISSGNVRLGSDNALGHTADVSLASGTGFDMSGWSQTMESLHSAAGSSLNLNNGSLILQQGGESLGTLSGDGQLSLNGGELIVSGANQGFTATTTIASAATATLDNAQGLGSGDITLQGDLNLAGAKGVLSNQLSGEGVLNLQDGAVVALSNKANTFAGDILVATGTQLTAQGAGTLGSATVTDNGTVILDSTSDWTLVNSINGNGGVNKTGSGTVIVGTDQTYSGDTHISAGALQVAGYFSSTGTVFVEQAGTLKGNGSIAGSVNNSGVIDLTGETAGNTLTINGDYASDNGQLWVNSELGDDQSTHDELSVKGNTSGNTLVTVNNMHGLGAQTVNGIELVDVQGQSEGTFSLQGRAVSGAYEYSLNQADNGNWYLQSETGKPDPDPTPDAPVLRPEAGAYLANQSLANSVFITTMHDRNGENRQSGEDAPATWAHFNAGHTNSNAGGDAVSLDSDTSVLRVGSDVLRHDFGDQRINAGLMFGYADADTDSSAKHVSGNASGNLKGYNFGIYATWYGGSAEQKSGPYVDSWLQYGTFHNSVKGDDLAEESYHAHNWSGSLEVGYDMPVGGFESLTLQPQFQAIYTKYSQGSHTEGNGTRISSEDSGGTTTRLGARLYGALGDSGSTQPFVEMNWWHGGSSNSIEMDSTSVNQSVPVSRYEVKFGAQTNVTKNVQLFVNAGVLAGKEDYSSVEGFIGGKYAW